MMKLMTAAGLALVTACAAQPSPQPHPELAYADTASIAACDIRATRIDGGWQLEAIVDANRAAQGDFNFVISANGAGGASDLNQGGAVDLRPGERAKVGFAQISQRDFHAELTLRDAYGELCHVERSA